MRYIEAVLQRIAEALSTVAEPYRRRRSTEVH